jgi:hypothetical protein
VEGGWGKPFDEWGLELLEMLLGTERRVASLAARDAEGKRAHATSGTLHSERWKSRPACLCYGGDAALWSSPSSRSQMALLASPGRPVLQGSSATVAAAAGVGVELPASSLGRLISPSARLRKEKGAATATPQWQAGPAGSGSHGGNAHAH